MLNLDKIVIGLLEYFFLIRIYKKTFYILNSTAEQGISKTNIYIYLCAYNYFCNHTIFFGKQEFLYTYCHIVFILYIYISTLKVLLLMQPSPPIRHRITRLPTVKIQIHFHRAIKSSPVRSYRTRRAFFPDSISKDSVHAL